MTSRSSGRAAQLVPHLFAAAVALAFAFAVFRSDFMRSGLQFVAPLIAILVVHIAWIVGTGRAAPGYAGVALRRTAQTAVGLTGAILVIETLAPMPSEAAGGENVLGGILMVLACLVVLAAALAVVGLAIYVAYRMLAALMRIGRGPRSDDSDRANDAGTLVVVIVLLSAASAEGLPGGYSFDGRGTASVSYRVGASAADAWVALGTATSAAYTLPAILHSLPQPVAVTIDEGVVLGANRVVRIAGREGAGDLSLRVTERTATRVCLTVLSDTSPMANWVAFRSITYEVLTRPRGTELTVTLEYENLLAPAWVFGPMVKGAAHLAADVLAKDTMERAEARRGV